MKQFRQIKNIRGFTLIELMVGLALGVVVMGGVLAVYMPTIKSWNASASLAQIHDTESLVHDIFGTGIRQAGLLACGHNAEIIDGVGIASQRGDIAKWAFKPTDFLKTSFKAFAADEDVASLLGADIQSNRLKNKIDTGSDIIGDAFFVLAPSRGFYRVDAHSAGTNAKVLTLSTRLSSTVNFKAGEYFIVNDCDNPVLIRATQDASSNWDSDEGKATISLNYTNTKLNNYPHPVNTVVNVFEPAIYYLRAKNGVPTLYKATIGAGLPLSLVHTPILTGVENMRVEYGIADSSGNYVDHYETIRGPHGTGNTATATLDNVLTVRVSVMIQAPGGSSTQSNMAFPNLKGELRYCFKPGESSKEGFADACPEFISTVDGDEKTHKVVQFTYILPRIVSI